MALSWATAVLLIVPDLALALGLLVLAVRSGWLPTGGMVSVGFDALSMGQKIRDVALHLVLPVTVLVASALPVLLRHVRAAVAEALEARVSPPRAPQVALLPEQSQAQRSRAWQPAQVAQARQPEQERQRRARVPAAF